jgi:serine/threonine protein kinase
VYLARRADGREVALKLLPLELDETRKKRFEVEASVGTMLVHPDIIQVFECGTLGDQGWIAMERLEGAELSVLRGDAHLSLERRVEVVVRVALALHYAHGHEIVHRDVKPSNIFLTKAGDVKLLDFGIARLKANKITKTGYIVGTPQYMSPEQISGVAIDARADVFSSAWWPTSCWPAPCRGPGTTTPRS